jgi:hypothetical protein
MIFVSLDVLSVMCHLNALHATHHHSQVILWRT